MRFGDLHITPPRKVGGSGPPQAPEVKRALIVHEDEVIDAVVGYRAWQIHFYGGRAQLVSIFQPQIKWHPKEVLEKQCLCASNLCTCGIYAWSRVPGRGDLAGAGVLVWMQPPEKRVSIVVGEVYLWGKIKIHEVGYRAEFALPAAFYTNPRHELEIEIAALQYGVPLVDRDAE